MTIGNTIKGKYCHCSCTFLYDVSTRRKVHSDWPGNAFLDYGTCRSRISTRLDLTFNVPSPISPHGEISGKGIFVVTESSRWHKCVGTVSYLPWVKQATVAPLRKRKYLHTMSIQMYIDAKKRRGGTLKLEYFLQRPASIVEKWQEDGTTLRFCTSACLETYKLAIFTKETMFCLQVSHEKSTHWFHFYRRRILRNQVTPANNKNRQ